METKKRRPVKMPRAWWRAGLLAAGLLLVIAGCLRGEANLVLQKAVMICLECIGIG